MGYSIFAWLTKPGQKLCKEVGGGRRGGGKDQFLQAKEKSSVRRGKGGNGVLILSLSLSLSENHIHR